ncbi:MAG: hypothetical protein IT552_03945 [Sphingomonadaceae bacterium]|nr:hypothetical protein [Sphingomonadaceae bacterium]
MIDPEFINPVWPGFAWSQEFEMDAALAPAGAVIRISLSQQGQTRLPSIAVNLTRPDATRHVLSLTALQTSNLRAPGMLEGDFVMRLVNGTETPMNLRLELPVELPLTPPVAP